ncbi:hypothetical protein JS756_34335 [Streptomyces actuosus]|uniref:Uncharacterized protein n=1 Tax=Streptomyces actuosus TaxID=1885 RepID=A0ABS2W1E4_STRAS|nr:hypothetical protein [Streptomyces actuosus]MBN0049073.1 hypothetical protein [Streptomyces actuosus]
MTDHDPSATDAAAALHAARTAQAAARVAQTVPRGLVLAQGAACAVECAALGLAGAHEEGAAPLTALGLLACVAFLVLMWRGVRHGGSLPRLRYEGRAAWRVLVVPAATIAVGALVAIPYGLTGALVALGLVCALDFWRRVARTESA